MSLVDIGIDLGTANVIITIGGKGIVINEPSVVAYDKKKKRVVAVGEAAYRMIGRTPEYIVAVKPLKDGVISDNGMAEVMVREYIKKASNSMIIRPRVILCVPSSVTDIESRAVVEAALSAGARKVCLIQEPIAALLGSGADISRPDGMMVVDIGGGTSDIAVVSFNGIVDSASVKMAGSKFDNAIIDRIKKKYNLLIGEKTAENIKKKLTNVFDAQGEKSMSVKGINLLKGLPDSITITDLDLYEVLYENVMKIIEKIKEVLERTPPELAGDILKNGITLTGGGALLGGLDKLISQEIGAPCFVAENALECVARGIQTAFDYADGEYGLLDGFEKVSLYKYK